MKKIQKAKMDKVRKESEKKMSLLVLHLSISLAPSFPKGVNQI